MDSNFRFLVRTTEEKAAENPFTGRIAKPCTKDSLMEETGIEHSVPLASFFAYATQECQVSGGIRAGRSTVVRSPHRGCDHQPVTKT